MSLSYEYLPLDKENRSTLVINGVSVGRVHCLKRDYPWINVHDACFLKDQSVIESKGLTVDYTPKNKSVRLKVTFNSWDPDVNAKAFFDICLPKTFETANIKRVIKPVTAESIRDLKKIEPTPDDVERFLEINSFPTMVEYIPAPEPRVDYSTKRISKSWVSRIEQKKANALIRADYKCEYNPGHTTFISRRTNKPYIEVHHLIPFGFWESFDNSLDVEANLTCLCSNCHNEIHYGKEARRIIEALYKKRSDELISAGIGVSIEQLLGMYEGEYIVDPNKSY